MAIEGPYCFTANDLFGDQCRTVVAVTCVGPQGIECTGGKRENGCPGWCTQIDAHVDVSLTTKERLRVDVSDLIVAADTVLMSFGNGCLSREVQQDRFGRKVEDGVSHLPSNFS